MAPTDGFHYIRGHHQSNYMLTKEWLENRLKELNIQLNRVELTKIAVEGAIQECNYHLEQLTNADLT